MCQKFTGNFRRRENEHMTFKQLERKKSVQKQRIQLYAYIKRDI